MEQQKRLVRSRQHRMLAGVAGGLAEYLNVDPTLVRLAWVLAALFPPTALFAIVGYLLAWLIMPEAGEPPR
ncbi:MAG: PspC domain-containing protein [Armatimonadota bacterium]|nr:PspC domain-containing protein [Armatimonadota bacterium]MDR7447727.1 PspC domain-containing protein [Armatimonadota bacterium]MDR7458502.1 PspC domain-containing protein [Armatimonadota bacterium]MDR7479939.1 PspC domain-containing protein [Armatimonadota bacterium]MDR7488151.1 PspC domain-containing protein [Armatimonadota bacterium]